MAKKSYFLRSTWNLATKSLEESAWPQSFRNHKPEYRPKALSRYLESLLKPEDVRANKNLRYERMRADLNKYRPWLMHIFLQRTLEEYNAANKGGSLPADRVILPEDMPKVIEDLYRFHKHKSDIAACAGKPEASTIQHYKSLEQLRDAVIPYRPPSPLTAKERDDAFHRHIKEYGGDGGAEIVSTLKNGTKLIHIKTEEASIALGSPHWCTAYRNRPTLFNNYKDNLLMVLEPDGRRYQLQFNKLQCMDANDKFISLDQIAADNPGLTTALAPFSELAEFSFHAMFIETQMKVVNSFTQAALESPSLRKKCIEFYDPAIKIYTHELEAVKEEVQTRERTQSLIVAMNLQTFDEHLKKLSELKNTVTDPKTLELIEDNFNDIQNSIQRLKNPEQDEIYGPVIKRDREMIEKRACLLTQTTERRQNLINVDAATQTAAISGTHSAEVSRPAPALQPMA
jgi:hypothetical protein